MISATVSVNLSLSSIPPPEQAGPGEHLARDPIALGLMGPLVVVEVVKPEVGAQFPPGFTGVGVSFQVHLFILHCAPQPLHEDVVGIPPLPVRADLHLMVLKDLGELTAGELAPLVGVEHLRRAFLQSLLQGANAEVGPEPAPDPDRGVLDNRQASTSRANAF